MIILAKPEKYVPWWVGRTGQCSTCGTVIKLEESDKDSMGFIPPKSYDGRSTAGHLCPTCDEGIWIKKEDVDARG